MTPPEKPVYRQWDTPSKTFPPILIQYGEAPWQTQVKIGDEWLPASDLRIQMGPQGRSPHSVELKLHGHLRFEYVGPPGDSTP